MGGGFAAKATFGFLLAAACAAREPEIAVSDLPPYTREEAATYDDSIAPDAFDEDASRPHGERFERIVDEADFIVPVRLVAINAKRADGSVRYQLIAEPAGPALKGTTPSGPLEFEVSRASPSQAMLKSLDTQLVGLKLILMARRYQLDGKMVMHFRAEADTVDAREAVASALEEPGAAVSAP
jgi:hypothetical protein